MKSKFKFLVFFVIAFFFFNALFYFLLVTDLSEGYKKYLDIIGTPASLVFQGDSLYQYFEKHKNISHGIRMMAVLVEYFLIPCVVDIVILLFLRFGISIIKQKSIKQSV